MPLTSVPLDSIEERHIQDLVVNHVREGKTIEFKELLDNSDSGKKKLLASVSAFANASGGDLIYGVKAREGEAIELRGLENINADETILGLDALLRDCIEPKIVPMVTIKAISVRTSRYVIIIRVRRSWNLPHAVKFRNYWRFYSRSSAGNYPLDVQELRSAFLLAETTTERIKNFRTQRLSTIMAGEPPVPLIQNPKIVLHMIPLAAFNQAITFDLSILFNRYPGGPRPIATNWDFRYNFDGIVTYSPIESESGSTRTYLQIFRNGIIESVQTTSITKPKIPFWYEKDLVEALPVFLSYQKELGVELPIIIMLSLVDVLGCYIWMESPAFLFSHTIDRNILMIPDVLIENYDCDAAMVMKPIFDMVWNAGGRPRSLNYSEAGEWAPRRS